MALAAYASLLSLAHVLDQIQHPVYRRRLCLDTEQLRGLQEKVHHLQDFLEDYSQRRISQEVEDLVRQIPVVAYEAEDVIDSYVVYELGTSLDRSDDHDAAALSCFYRDLDKEIQKIDSMIKELMGVVCKEEWDEVKEQKPVVDSLSSRVLPSGGGNCTMVGFDERLVQIIDELTRDEPDLKIFTIVGMGEYSSVQEILLGLLSDERNDNGEKSLAELGKQLHQKLFRRIYLIVMDDVWSNKAWDDLKQFFPNNGNESRVVVTTRLSNVAVSLGSQDPYLMDFLDEKNCWNLLCEKVFAQKHCPYPELEQIGKDIAKGCKGLPLALVVIGGLLANSNKTREYWEFVAENVKSFANSEDNEYCLKVLSLSYNYLSIHLKPCLLYMRVFPEDKSIKVSTLIKLWVAEGLINTTRGKTLEEVAERYLKDFIDMNLFSTRERKASGEIKSIGIHDLLRDFCLRESDKENFLRVSRVQRNYNIREENKCYLCDNQAFSSDERIHISKILVSSRSTSVAIAWVCYACQSTYPYLIRLRWVKLFDKLGEEFLQHTKLRYIRIGREFYYTPYNKEIMSTPSTLPLLWNLQTLYLKPSYGELEIVLPSVIWEMPQLRHINVKLVVLPDPMDAQDTTTVLENLQKLSTVHNFMCTEEVVERIPNLKKLKVCYFANLEEC
ncbi:UNVERIFIED_CONTAM: putative late blight resistance proteinR1B-14 [Sesamum calycinum]|uniref:Late blight resistance proteinR1B-14 n=1 Tax=Sesamum calycinum TaxID=2727403 RepID=A0AAW2Q4N6_9LAMI